MQEATATAAVPAPQAQAPKSPAWMSCATRAELDAYLKKAKIGGARADEMRARWAAEHPDASLAASAQDIADASKERLEAITAGGGKQPPKKPPVRSDAAPTGPSGPLRTRYIDPLMVDVKEGWNARVDFGDLAELRESIRAQKKLDGHGVINDIRVKEKADGRYELVDGERRLTCVLGLIDEGEAFEFGIPAKVEPAEATDDDLIIKMFVANAGKPFLPYEEGMYYARLRKSGWTIKQIEEATGRSDNSIVGALALLDADDDLVDAITKGEIGATLAKSIAVNARGDRQKQKELTAKARAAKRSGDRAAMKKVHKEIDDSRREKAAKKAPGLKLKERRLDEAEVAHLGGEVGARLKELMEKVGLPFDTDMEEWISNDRELQIAASFGALNALKTVMGVKSKVVF